MAFSSETGAPFCCSRNWSAWPRGKTAHLFQPLDRNEGGQGLAFALDDELVVPEGDTVQHVADALPDGEGGDFFSHRYLLVER